MNARENKQTPRVRVYMPTYRRHRLLQRAIASLQAQTLTDWICEVHNDDPNDPEPGRIVEKLNDPRFILCQHERNLGGTETFNLFFRGTEEPFSSILEDDNWWEPDFLEKMIATAEEFPDVKVFWSNQKLWQEETDGSFRDVGRCVHPYSEGDRPKLIEWGQEAQIYGAIHAVGAALFRIDPDHPLTTPAIPQAGIEIFRERMFSYPIVFVPQPVAHFSMTLTTNRATNRFEWPFFQALFAASFLKHADYSDEKLEGLWKSARAKNPPSTNSLIYASLVEPDCRHVRRFAKFADWLLFLRGVLGRPRVFWNVLRCRKTHQSWWTFLDSHTAERFADLRRPSHAPKPDVDHRVEV